MYAAGFLEVCNLVIDIEQGQRAYATYPDAETLTNPIAPGNELRFGATIPFAHGFPHAKLKSFDSCSAITSVMDAEEEEEHHHASKKLRGHA